MVKNLVYLAKVLHRLQLAGKLSPSGHTEEGEREEEEEGRGEGRRVVRDLEWLERRMCRLANYEAGHQPKQTIRVSGTTSS